VTVKRCVNVYWRTGRRVRILHPAFGYGGKLGTIQRVRERDVLIHVKWGKKPHEWDVVSYPDPTKQLRLV
jgi:hypothetical protein